MNALVGNERYDISFRYLNLIGNGVPTPGLRNIDNTTSQNTFESLSRRRVVGFYGNLNASW